MAKNKKLIEYSVRYLKNTMKLSDAQIIEELKITELELQNILDSEPKSTKSKNLMINETSAKKHKTVSIMTQAASQLNDELNKKLQNVKKKQTNDCIFRPNDN
jgi:hypothetical protein